jgi:hypothetical protein
MASNGPEPTEGHHLPNSKANPLNWGKRRAKHHTGYMADALTPHMPSGCLNAMLQCNICIARLLCSRSIAPIFSDRDWLYLLPEQIDSNRRHPPPPGCRLYFVWCLVCKTISPPNPALPSAHPESRSARLKHLPTLAGGVRRDVA